MNKMFASKTTKRKHNVISRQQHGFINRRSTSTNLMETMNDWTLALKNKNGVTVAYIDYSKAFDTVCHSKLGAKLVATGITGNLLKWLKDFLNCRTQVTRVGMSLSDTVDILVWYRVPVWVRCYLCYILMMSLLYLTIKFGVNCMQTMLNFIA